MTIFRQFLVLGILFSVALAGCATKETAETPEGDVAGETVVSDGGEDIVVPAIEEVGETQSEEVAVERKLKIAVVPVLGDAVMQHEFSVLNDSYASDIIREGLVWNDVAKMMMNAWSSDPRFEVISAQKTVDTMDALSNKDVIYSDLDVEIKLGSMLGADAVVIGRVTQLSAVARQLDSSLAGSNGENKHSIVANLILHLKVIDVKEKKKIYDGEIYYRLTDKKIKDENSDAKSPDQMVKLLYERTVEKAVKTLDDRMLPQMLQEDGIVAEEVVQGGDETIVQDDDSASVAKNEAAAAASESDAVVETLDAQNGDTATVTGDTDKDVALSGDTEKAKPEEAAVENSDVVFVDSAPVESEKKAEALLEDEE